MRELPFAEELRTVKQQLDELRGQFEALKQARAYDRARIDALEAQSPGTSDIPDRLFEAMALVGRRQVTFSEAGKLLAITRQRVHQAKGALAADTRFEIIQSGSHRQRLLIRLKEVRKSNCQI